MRWLHADAETKGVKPERVVISFGPEHSLLEQRQVELAWEEARTLIPKPAIIVFAAFEFDPEAAKDIDELTKEKTGMTFLTAQMNADLLTEDLKKKRASNQSFWLVGRPDVDLRQIKSGEQKGKWQVEVNGFDYYNTRTGTIAMAVSPAATTTYVATATGTGASATASATESYERARHVCWIA